MIPDIKKLLEENRTELISLLENFEFIEGLKDMEFFTSDNLDDMRRDLDLISSCSLNDVRKFNRLVEALLYKNHDQLALKLDPNVIDMCDFSRCDPSQPYKNEFSFLRDDECTNRGYEKNDNCELVWEDNSNSATLGETYHIVSHDHPSGFCLLINNYYTKGTFKEMQKFRNIFYQLNYDVIMEKNLTAQEIENKLITISQDERLTNHSSFIFMIITHGSADRNIGGFDRKPLNIDSLVDIMKNKRCIALAGKPKIFFINACRTGITMNLDPGVSIENFRQLASNYGQLIFKSISGEIDYLICFTTMQGFPAFVSRETGTKFGSVLAENLIKRAHYQDLERILKRVLSQLNREHSPPNREMVENIIKNSENVVKAFRSLQQFSFPVFSWEIALPKHLYLNLRSKRSFVSNELQYS